MFRTLSIAFAGTCLVAGTLGCTDLESLPPITIGGGGGASPGDPVQQDMTVPTTPVADPAPPVAPPPPVDDVVVATPPVERPPLIARPRVSCESRVQNKIAWDYNGSKRWNPVNVRRLCKGAEYSSQPSTCFNRVMHGNVSWGGSTRWQWKNAIDLCEGTKSAARTISCFKGKISGGTSWQRAIRGCERRIAVVRPREAPPAVSASPTP